MTSRRGAGSLALALLVLAASCGKKEATRASADQPKFDAPVLTAFKQAGLTVSVFEQTAARPYQAKACSQGEVGGLAVLLCAYDSAAAAGVQRQKLEQFTGGALSGVVRADREVALAVADRGKVDVQGKRINQLLKAYQDVTTAPAPR